MAAPTCPGQRKDHGSIKQGPQDVKWQISVTRDTMSTSAALQISECSKYSNVNKVVVDCGTVIIPAAIKTVVN